jgi:hypothetical protein
LRTYPAMSTATLLRRMNFRARYFTLGGLASIASPSR